MAKDEINGKEEIFGSIEEKIIEAKNFFETQKKLLGEVAKKGENVVRINFEDLAESSPELAE